MKRFQAGNFKDKAFNPAPPFLLDLSPEAEEDPWQCIEVLRRLPGKRWVLALQRGNETALCKLLFRGKDYHREIRGHRLLLAADLATPALLSEYRYPHTDGHGILYQYIDAPTLEQINSVTTLSSDSPALLHTIATTAAMHKSGLRQVDIHPGNFLYREGSITIVDTAAVIEHQPPLKGRHALENLADLLAQFKPGQIKLTETIWTCYREVHPEPGWRPEQLDRAITKMRRLRWRHYQRKLKRSCSEFAVTKNASRFTVLTRQADSTALEEVLKQPDRTMANGEYLKQGNTATVVRNTLDDLPIVIKRYNIKNWRHRFNRSLRPTRAWHSWRNAHYLLFSGLPTPTPIALQEERCGPFRGRAYFITEFNPGIDLKTALDQGDRGERKGLLKQFADIIIAYRAAGISHGDMKADNFIVTTSGVTIIDLDPMRYHRNTNALDRALARDIKRFLANFSGEDSDDIARLLLPLLPQQLRP